MPLVALDLDGTLVDQAAAARAWASAFVDHWHLPDAETDTISTALTVRRPKGEVFRELIARHEISTTSDDVWRDYRTQMPDLVTVTDDDRCALIDLRSAGWTLGIITNGMSDNQGGKIRRTGLDALVDGWVISEEVGVRKPDPALFRALSARVGCPLQGWMIGDSVEHDVAGGASVGLRTAWIKGDDASPTDRAPDLIVDSVAAAAAAILARA